jgi:hypothetical protein
MITKFGIRGMSALLTLILTLTSAAGADVTGPDQQLLQQCISSNDAGVCINVGAQLSQRGDQEPAPYNARLYVMQSMAYIFGAQADCNLAFLFETRGVSGAPTRNAANNLYAMGVNGLNAMQAQTSDPGTLTMITSARNLLNGATQC